MQGPYGREVGRQGDESTEVSWPLRALGDELLRQALLRCWLGLEIGGWLTAWRGLDGLQGVKNHLGGEAGGSVQLDAGMLCQIGGGFGPDAGSLLLA